MREKKESRDNGIEQLDAFTMRYSIPVVLALGLLLASYSEWVSQGLNAGENDWVLVAARLLLLAVIINRTYLGVKNV